MTLPDSPEIRSLPDIRGLHLGRCSRRILLLSPGPNEEPQVLSPERAGRAAAESHRRAMRRLAAFGLIELSFKVEQVQTRRERNGGRLEWDGHAGVYCEAESQRIPVWRSVEKRAVKLTPEGALVVDRLRPVLETGGRIRWASAIKYESQ
jgi:hypothetical protein